MEHVDLLPAALVAGFSVATKFAVDMVARAYQSWKGKEMPGWAKQLISLGVATAVTVQARVDLFAGLRGEETTSGYILTAMILAALPARPLAPARWLAEVESAFAHARWRRGGWGVSDCGQTKLAGLECGTYGTAELNNPCRDWASRPRDGSPRPA
ncbi:MAG: hypothetical protein H5T86_15290 [Armatimonadetes bacterium]|nr:hypothetical protein [Armatimonadota bacterium]